MFVAFNFRNTRRPRPQRKGKLKLKELRSQTAGRTRNNIVNKTDSMCCEKEKEKLPLKIRNQMYGQGKGLSIAKSDYLVTQN